MTVVAYLPPTKEGHEVLWLMKSTFLAGLMFRIGTAVFNKRRQKLHVVELADIPLKTSTNGGV